MSILQGVDMHPSAPKRSVPLAVTGLALSMMFALAAWSGPTQPQRNLVVLELTPGSPALSAVSRTLTASLAQGMKAHTTSRIITFDDVKAMLDTQATQALMGCEDPRCFVSVSDTLAADQIVFGSVGAVDDTLMVFLSVVDVATQSVVARHSKSFPRSRLRGDQGASRAVAAMRDMARQLFDPEGKRAGDTPLNALRMALIFDETDEKGALKIKRVRTCVEDTLINADVDVVDAEQVAILNSIDAAQLVKGRLPDFLTTEDVDVVVAGNTVFMDKPSVKDTAAVGVTTTVRVIQVDTARVVVSKQIETAANHFSRRDAVIKGAKKICDEVRPAIEDTLRARRARGHKVVVDVESAGLSIESLQSRLKRHEFVRRTKVRRSEKGRTLLDVVVEGGDGIRLAVAIQRAAAGFVVEKAEPGRVRLRYAAQ